MEAVEESQSDSRPPLSEDVHDLLEGVSKLDHDNLLVFLQELHALLPTDKAIYLQELAGAGSKQKKQQNGSSDSCPRHSTG